jgi:phosphate transport system protein
MGKHLQREIQNLMRRLIILSSRVEESIEMAVKSLEKRDEQMAKTVIKMDEEIDQTEIDIEEECLKILALYQPVAIDLRYIIAALKINNDLERIGDLAVDIAEYALILIENPRPIKYFNFDFMFENVQNMLQKSLDSLVHLDSDKALEVLKADDKVDKIDKQICKAVLLEIKRDHENAEFLIQNIHISRRLERVADLATNIAEDLIYLTKGEIIRHGRSIDQNK